MVQRMIYTLVHRYTPLREDRVNLPSKGRELIRQTRSVMVRYE